MQIKPIHNDEEYEAALQEIDRLWDAANGTPEGDTLEILVTLVEAYEKGRYELPPPDPIQAIEYFMESRGWTRKELEPSIGNRGRVSEVLNRKRPLTIAMIRKLEQTTGIPASILIQPYATEQEQIDSEFVVASAGESRMRNPVAAD
ncbi:MAG: transcriptional regulator [Chloroflexi bacterium]|nr:transcriptional regulator [Chloroflexota bacterium]